MYNKLILTKNTTFSEAISLLDKSGNGVLPVVNEANKLTGIITDGDVRKAILNNQLDLENVINTKPYKLDINKSRSQIITYLKKVQRRHIPLVNEQNVFVKMFTLDDIEFNLKPNWVVIMAGGLGSRLGELTKNTPKPMLKVGKKPMLENLINIFSEHGFSNFYISVNYKSEVIKEYFGDGSNLGVNIIYIEEKKRMGTAGSLALIKNKISEPFFVINGDVLTTLDFEELLKFHIDKCATATMCTRRYSYQVPYGVVNSDRGLISSIEEKPSYDFFVNTGIYVLNPDILKLVPKDTFFDMPDLFQSMISQGVETLSYEINDYWVDIGQIQDYQKVLNDFKF